MSLLKQIVCRLELEEINNLKKQIISNQKLIESLQEEIKRLKDSLAESKKVILNYQHYKLSDKYRGLPTMEDLISSGKAIAADSWTEHFRNQTGIKLVYNSAGNREQKVCQVVQTGISKWRIPKSLFLEIVSRIPVDMWDYKTVDSYGRTFACNDFAVATKAEIELSPYWDIFFGIAAIQNHRINFTWFSDDTRFYYFEPQTDLLWVPDISNPKEFPIQLIT